MKKLLKALAAALLAAPALIWDGIRYVLRQPPLPTSPVEAEVEDEIEQARQWQAVGHDEKGRPSAAHLIYQSIAADRTLSEPPDLSHLGEAVIGWRASLNALDEARILRAGVPALEAHMDERSIIKGLRRVPALAEYRREAELAQREVSEERKAVIAILEEHIADQPAPRPRYAA